MSFLVCHHVCMITDTLYLGNLITVLPEVNLCPCTHTCTGRHMPTQTHRQVHTQAWVQGHTEHSFTNGQEHVSVETSIRGDGYLVEFSVGVTNFSKLYAFIFNCGFLLVQWAGLLSFSIHSTVYPFGLPQATACCFCVPQTMAAWILVCRVSHAAHNIPYS